MSTQVGVADRCRNCDAEISEKYCSRCGQRHLAKGLDVGEIASELFDSVVSLDSKLWRTIVGLTRNPGKLASDYVSGKRARFVNPVRYCIAGIALSAGATLATGEFEQLSASLLPEGVTTADETVRLFTEVFAKYLNLLAILSVPVYTVCLRLLFWRAGRNMAEIFSFSCFIVGHVSMLGVMGTLANNAYFMGIWPSMAINGVVTTYGIHVFFGKKLGYTLVAAGLSYLIFLLVLNGMFWILYTLHGGV